MWEGVYALVQCPSVWEVGQEGPVNLFNSRAQKQEAHLIADIGHATEPLPVTKTIFWFSTCLLSVLSNWIRTWARKKNVRYQASSEMSNVMESRNTGQEGESTHTSDCAAVILKIKLEARVKASIQIHTGLHSPHYVNPTVAEP